MNDHGPTSSPSQEACSSKSASRKLVYRLDYHPKLQSQSSDTTTNKKIERLPSQSFHPSGEIPKNLRSARRTIISPALSLAWSDICFSSGSTCPDYIPFTATHSTSSSTAPSLEDERDAWSSGRPSSTVDNDPTLPYSTSDPVNQDTLDSPTPGYTSSIGTYISSCFTSPQSTYPADHRLSHVSISDYSTAFDFDSDLEDWSLGHAPQPFDQSLSGSSTPSSSASTSSTDTASSLASVSSILSRHLNQEHSAWSTPGSSSTSETHKSFPSTGSSDGSPYPLTTAPTSPTLSPASSIKYLRHFFTPIDIDLDQEELEINSSFSSGRSEPESSHRSTASRSPTLSLTSSIKDIHHAVDHFVTDPVQRELEVPFRETINQAEYSVTRERPPNFIASLNAMAPTQKQAVQPGRALPHLRQTIHQRFDVLVELADARRGRPDEENDNVRPLKRARITDHDFEIRRKGRFIKFALRRKDLKKRRRRAETPPVQPTEGQTPLTTGPTPSPPIRGQSPLTTGPFRFQSNFGSVVENQRRLSSGGSWPRIDRADVSPYALAPVPAPVSNIPAYEKPYIDALNRLAQYLRDHNALCEGYTRVNPLIKPYIDTLHLKDIGWNFLLRNSRVRHDLITNQLVPLTLTNDVSSLELAKFGLTTDQVGCAQTPNHVTACRKALKWLQVRSQIYFHALELELTTGCRCVQYIHGPDDTIAFRGPGQAPTGASPRFCHCGRWLSELDQTGWQEASDSGLYPSRIKPMIVELQSMIKLVMPLGLKPTVVPSIPLGEDEPLPPVVNTEVFHSSDNFLEEVDPVFLAGRIRAGNLDYNIFRRLANAMKSYCALPRDVDVDKMAAYGDVGNGIEAIKTCFDILLQMRIDQVNSDLIKNVQPWLKDTAIHHELASFERALDYEESHLQDSDTRNWIFAASQKVLAEADSEQTAHLLGQCHCKNRTELVIRSIVEGVCLLIFANWSEPDKCDWKLLSGVPPRSHEEGPNCFMPESMRKDTNRLYYFSREARIIAAEATILATFREILSRHRPDLFRHEVAQATHACATVMKSHRKLNATYYRKLTAAPGENPLAFLDNINGSETNLPESSEPSGLQPSAFVIELAISLCFPNRLRVYNKPGAYFYTPAQKTELITVAHELVSRLEVNMEPDSPVFAKCLGHLKTLLTQRFSSALSAMRLKEFRSMFPAPNSDCFLATLPLLKEIDVQLTMLSIGKFAFERIPANHNRYISQAHLERWSIAWIHHNNTEDRKLAEKLDLTPLDGRLVDFSQQILQMLDLHLRVYRDIYLGKGMLTRSGRLSLFEKKQAQRRRMAANLVNARLVEHLPTRLMELTAPTTPSTPMNSTKPTNPPSANCNVQ